MAGRLQDKVVCITGAAQGIGAGIAEAMAKEGARIIIGDVNDDGASALAAQIGATALHLDVSSQEDWQALADHVGAHFGKLDILVNNAGLELVKPMRDHSLADWRGVMRSMSMAFFSVARRLRLYLANPGNPDLPLR